MMEDRSTFFAPAYCLAKQDLLPLIKLLAENKIVKIILDAVAGYVLVLNEERQIVAANPEIIKKLEIHDPECIIGLRPGEMLHCIHSRQGPGGCGTSKACRSCGAVIAMLATLKNNATVEGECRITSEVDGDIHASEFKVRCSPLVIRDQRFLVFVLSDISDSKRRDVLQNIFIHDMSSTISALKAWSELSAYEDPVNIIKKIVLLSDEMTDIIDSQRLLLLAESGELMEDINPVNLFSLFTSLDHYFKSHKVAQEKNLRLVIPSHPVIIKTDLHILKRVLINMLKNAFEATEKNGTVTLKYDMKNHRHSIHVHNIKKIPEAIALHIFERSFSTKKEPGHGLGTYCMKLLGEHYLKGNVSFVSTEEQGTWFSFYFPRDHVE
jgi:hypothetical protein